MSATDNALIEAQAGDRRAVERVFRDVHPAACRIARALAGEEGRAEQIVDTVFRNALRVLQQWSSWGDPETWFFHQVAQTTRRVCQGRPASGEDLLVTAAVEQSPAYVAFVRAIRRLPSQQAEAFLLHYGERLNPRLLGVSMDCSTRAAQTHLSAAEAAIRQIAGDAWPALTAVLYQSCRAMSPPREETEQFVRRHVGTWAGRRARKRAGRLLILLIVLSLLLLAWNLFQASKFANMAKDLFSPTSQPTGSSAGGH